MGAHETQSLMNCSSWSPQVQIKVQMHQKQVWWLLRFKGQGHSIGTASDWKARSNAVQVPGVAKDLFSFFTPESTSSADSYSVRTAPVCNRMHQICVHIKNSKLWHVPLFDPMKILHTLLGMGCSALTAAVPYLTQVRKTQISHNGQRCTKTKQNFKQCRST